MKPSRKSRSHCARSRGPSTTRRRDNARPGAPAPAPDAAHTTLFSRPQPPTIPVSTPSFSRVPPGMLSIHPHTWHSVVALSEHEHARSSTKLNCAGILHRLPPRAARPPHARATIQHRIWRRGASPARATQPCHCGAMHLPMIDGWGEPLSLQGQNWQWGLHCRGSMCHCQHRAQWQLAIVTVNPTAGPHCQVGSARQVRFPLLSIPPPPGLCITGFDSCLPMDGCYPYHTTADNGASSDGAYARTQAHAHVSCLNDDH